MYDRWERLIAADTSEANAVKVPCPISYGIIDDLWIQFPDGCGTYDVATNTTYYLARCRVWNHQSPIAPRSAKKYLAADGYIMHVPNVNWPVYRGDARLDWEVWNLDDTYPHGLWLGCEWTPIKDIDRQIAQMEKQGRTLEEILVALRTAFRV